MIKVINYQLKVATKARPSIGQFSKGVSHLQQSWGKLLKIRASM